MALIDIFRKNPIESLDPKKLRTTESTLKTKSRELLLEVERIENEIKLNFEKSKKSSSRLEEKTLAARIKTLMQKCEMKSAAHAKVEKELTAISNLLIIKEHEADLKAAGVWESLRKVSPDKLQDHLTELQLVQEDREDQVKTITEMTSSMFKPVDSQEEELGDILKVMDAIKQGEMEPETAKDIITKREIEE